MPSPRILSAALCLMLAVVPGLAVAAPDDAEPVPTETTTQCKKDEVWDKKEKKCVPLKKEGMRDVLGDEGLYDAARELAYFGRPAEAIVLLGQMSDAGQPRVQNYLGFAHRKAGRMTEAMAHYREALRLDPDFVLARSYMGAGLAQMGDRAGALEQLREIERRAGTANRAYALLAAAVAGRKTDY